MQKLANISGYLLFVIVAAAPLALGAVDAWAWLSLAAIISLLGLVFAVGVIAKKQPLDIRNLIVPAILCGLAALWGCFQLSSAPIDWVHPISSAAQNILPDTRAAISLNPGATAQILIRWLMYAITFFIAFVWNQNADRARWALSALVIAGTTYAVYGLVVFFMGSDMALWVHKPMYQLDVTGPFINKNNFASYLGALLCVALALLLRRLVRDTETMRNAEFWRALLASCMGRSAWLFIAVIIMFSALLLTQSRAGLASFGIAFLILMALMRAAGIVRGQFFYWGAGALSVILISLFFLSGNDVFYRMVSEGEPARPQLYELATTALMDRPLLGHGLGSFPEVFQIYRTDDMPPKFFTERAHSVYLENLLELGIPAALCLFLGIGWLIARTAASLPSGQHHRTIPAATTAAVLMLCIHSLIDFPLQIPAITLLFAYLLALALRRRKIKPGYESRVVRSCGYFRAISKL